VEREITDSAGSPPATLESPERSALARRSFLNFLGLGAANGLQFVLVVLLARGLGQHDAGLFFESFALIRLLAVVAAFGLDVTAIQRVSVVRTRGEATGHVVRLAVLIAGSMSLAAALAVFALAPRIAAAFGSQELETVLRVMVVSLPAVVLQSVLIGATRGTGNMRPFVLIDQIADGVFRVVAIGAVLALGGGLLATAYAYTAAAILTTLAAAISASSLWMDRGPGVERASALLRFTSYQWGASVAGVGLLWADTLLLGLWRPPSEVAVYSIATRTVVAGMVFILPIGFAFQPVIARLYTLHDREGLRSMYSFATKWSTIVGCPPLIFLALFATPIITLLYQDSYSRGALPMALLALGQTFNAATGPCGHVVTMVGRSDLVLRNSVFALVVNLVLNLILIPPYGMVGAGAAWGISIAAWNVVRVVQVQRVLSMQPFGGWVGRVSCSILAFVVVAVLLRVELRSYSDLEICLLGAFGSAVAYLAALLATRAVDERDRVLPAPVLRLLRIRS
jgi:O-antigen/teichoic acid export membrane protein